MAKFAINTLEFTKVREKLSQYAGTAMGQRLAMELMSSSRSKTLMPVSIS